MQKIELGRLYGLRLTADRTAIVCGLALWFAIAFIATQWVGIPAVEALIGGLICALGHFFLELLHQLGHAYAARRTGYPMRGVHFWLAIGVSIYPGDEGELPGAIHIRRALGGPIASALISILLVIIALMLRPWDATPGWIAAFFLLDNLLVFTIGAMLPLGFTDGTTLMKWWGK